MWHEKVYLCLSDAVQPHCCVDTDTGISPFAQYTTVHKKVKSGPTFHVFVNCLQDKELTKTFFGSKHPASDYLSTVVVRSASV